MEALEEDLARVASELSQSRSREPSIEKKPIKYDRKGPSAKFQNRTKDRSFHFPKELSRCFTEAVVRDGPLSRWTYFAITPSMQKTQTIVVARPTSEDLEQVRQELVAEADDWTIHFIEYAPSAHQWLRSMVDFPADLIAADLAGHIEERPSHGKSGDFFYRIRSGASILLKSVEEDELKVWLKNMGRYTEHIEACQGQSLLMHVLSLGTMKLAKKVKPGSGQPHGKEFCVHVAMFSNGLVSPVPGRGMDEIYDLKGHTDGREVSEDDMERVPSITLKDAAFEKECIRLGVQARTEILDAVHRDLEYLEGLDVHRPGDGVMDYSLLIGRQGVREGEEGGSEVPAEGEIAWGRCNVVVSETGGARRACISIIDTATRYGTGKTVQNALGSVASFFGKSGLTVGGSAMPPDEYAARFREMCQNKFVAG